MANRHDMQIVVAKPNEPPFATTIPNTLEDMQKLVDGYIEVLRWKKYVLVFNEEGRLDGLPLCRLFGRQEIVGTLFVCKSAGEHFTGLTVEEVEECLALLAGLHVPV